MSAGTLEQAFIVLCGRCQHESRHYTKYRNDANEKLVLMGWRKTDTYGWLCPVCMQAVTEPQHVGERTASDE